MSQTGLTHADSVSLTINTPPVAPDALHGGLPPLQGLSELVAEGLKQVQEADINRVFGNFEFAGCPTTR